MAPTYPSNVEQSTIPSMSRPPELRTFLPPNNQTYNTIVNALSYPPICQPQSHHGNVATMDEQPWDTSILAGSTANESGYEGVNSSMISQYALP